jgi:sec-independent protein translocase protein TatB
MFDIGWQELFVIGIVTVVFLGPKELPRAIRTVTGLVRKARLMAFEFQRSVDEMVRESELDELRKQAEAFARTDVAAEVKRTVDPGGDIERELSAAAREAELDAEQAKRTIAPPIASEPAPGEPAPGEPVVEEPVPALIEPGQPLEDVHPPEDAGPETVPAPRRDQISG